MCNALLATEVGGPSGSVDDSKPILCKCSRILSACLGEPQQHKVDGAVRCSPVTHTVSVRVHLITSWIACLETTPGTSETRHTAFSRVQRHFRTLYQHAETDLGAQRGT